MYRTQIGFTLVELIVVIVLLGILGVTALGKFQDLSGDAQNAALEGIAAEVSGAGSINYAKALLGSTPALSIGSGGGATLDTSAAAGACTGALANLLTGNAFPTISNLDVGIVDTPAAADACVTVAPATSGAGNVYTCNLGTRPTVPGTGAFAGTTPVTVICTQ
jgi:prepilin-type N-terminal cleavage/methylation domain-containing protein